MFLRQASVALAAVCMLIVAGMSGAWAGMKARTTRPMTRLLSVEEAQKVVGGSSSSLCTGHTTQLETGAGTGCDGITCPHIQQYKNINNMGTSDVYKQACTDLNGKNCGSWCRSLKTCGTAAKCS